MSNEHNDHTPRPHRGKPPAAAPVAAPGPHSPFKRRTLRVITWGTTLALLCGTAVLVAVARNRQAPVPARARKQLTNVETISVKPAAHRESLALPARLEADRAVEISSELHGRLEKWLVEEGGHVRSGQVVAVLNRDELTAQLSQLEAKRLSAVRAAEVAQGQLAVMEVTLDKAEKDAAALELELESVNSTASLADKEYARIQPLAKAKIATDSALDSALNQTTQAKVAVAKAKDAIQRAAIGVKATRMQLKHAEAALQLSQAQVTEAESGIQSVRVQLAKTELKAPFGGRLEEHLVEQGEIVSPDAPVARVYDLSHIRAVVDVADRYVPFLDAANPGIRDYIQAAMPGAEQAIRARLVVPGPPKLTGGSHSGIELDARIARISQAADPLSNTFRVELRSVNPAEALKHGMIGRAIIDYLLYPEAIVIPLSAIQVADTGPRALVVEDQDGRDVATVRELEPISIKNAAVLVGHGIQPGDRLVVAGGKGVMHGEAVNVIMSDGVVQTAPPEDAERTDVIKVPAGYEATPTDANEAARE